MKSSKLIFAVLVVLVVLASYTSAEYDCRNFNFGVSEATVRSQEQGNFIGEKPLIHNLRGLTFIDYQPDAIYFHTYIFHNGGLYGLKTKKASLSGNDTKINALKEYDETLKKYYSSCIKGQLTESKDHSSDKDLNCFTVTYPNKTVYVNIEKESTEYFLTETTMQKGAKKL